MQRFKSRVRHFVALAIWFIGLIIFISLSIWNISATKKDAENRLIGEASRTAGELSSLIALSQWELDELTSKAAIAGAMDDERIYAIKITRDHNILAGQRRNYLWEPIPWDDEIAEYTIQGMNPIKIGSDIVGRVEVWLSPRLMNEENSLQMRREILRCIMISLIWTAVLVLVFWQWGDFRHLRNFLNKKAPDPDKIVLGLANQETSIDNPKEEYLPYSPINSKAGRKYQRTNPEAWSITCGMFKQTFSRAPNLMSRLFSDGELAGLCHIGHMLEQAAPCIGAINLAKTAKEMQRALNDPECTAKALPVEQCVFALEEVLDALSNE